MWVDHHATLGDTSSLWTPLEVVEEGPALGQLWGLQKTCECSQHNFRNPRRPCENRALLCDLQRIWRGGLERPRLSVYMCVRVCKTHQQSLNFYPQNAKGPWVFSLHALLLHRSGPGGYTKTRSLEVPRSSLFWSSGQSKRNCPQPHSLAKLPSL